MRVYWDTSNRKTGFKTQKQEDTIMKKIAALLLSLVLIVSTCSFALAESETPTVDKIKAAGKLVMMTNATFPPFEYQGDNGEIAGVDIDLAQKIADELGVELVVTRVDEFTDEVAPFQMVWRVVVTQPARIIEGKSVVVTGRQRYVISPRRLRYLDPFLRVVFHGIKGVSEFFVLVLRYPRYIHYPFALTELGVYPPVDEHPESEVFKLGDPFFRYRYRHVKSPFLFIVHLYGIT